MCLQLEKVNNSVGLLKLITHSKLHLSSNVELHLILLLDILVAHGLLLLLLILSVLEER
jgi:hypothetical protein